MSVRIATAEEFARKLADYISQNALSRKELRSVAESIGYRLGLLPWGNKLRLTNELVFLNAFFGSVMLRVYFEESDLVPNDVAEEIRERFSHNLLNQWMPAEMFEDYDRRLAVWGGLFAVWDDQEYLEEMGVLARTFYEFLTNTACDQGREMMLAMRFNGYAKLYLQSIDSLAAVFDPSRGVQPKRSTPAPPTEGNYFPCAKCGKLLWAPASDAGKTYDCPACKSKCTVPNKAS